MSSHINTGVDFERQIEIVWQLMHFNNTRTAYKFGLTVQSPHLSSIEALALYAINTVNCIHEISKQTSDAYIHQIYIQQNGVKCLRTRNK